MRKAAPKVQQHSSPACATHFVLLQRDFAEAAAAARALVQVGGAAPRLGKGRAAAAAAAAATAAAATAAAAERSHGEPVIVRDGGTCARGRRARGGGGR